MEIKDKYTSMERLEVYNLAAMSHVKVSFEMPEYTGNIDVVDFNQKLVFIKHLLVNYMEKFKKLLRPKKRNSIREALILLLNYMPTGLLKIIVKLMYVCM